MTFTEFWESLHYFFQEVLYFLRRIRLALIYLFGLTAVALGMIWWEGYSLRDVPTLVEFFTLNYIPTNFSAWKSILALVAIIGLHLAPVMAFVEIRTLSDEEKAELRARSFSNHFVVIGCGQLGKRICELLIELHFPFILVVRKENLEDNEFLEELRQMKLRRAAIIAGDAVVKDILLLAQVDKARAVIIAVRDDEKNYRIAIRVKKIAPDVRVLARIFDPDLAELLQQSPYADEVLSTTAIAVRPFIMGSVIDVEMEMIQPMLVRVTYDMIRTRKCLSDLEKELAVTILSIYREEVGWIRDPACEIHEDDIMCIQPESVRDFRKLLRTID